MKGKAHQNVALTDLERKRTKDTDEAKRLQSLVTAALAAAQREKQEEDTV
jgi:hypothetical protein